MIRGGKDSGSRVDKFILKNLWLLRWVIEFGICWSADRIAIVDRGVSEFIRDRK